MRFSRKRSNARSIGVEPVALRSLTLDLANMELLSWTSYRELLRDLKFANLQELRLRSIDTIPEDLTHEELQSVKTLRLEGRLRLQDPVSFVLLLVSNLPGTHAGSE